MELESGDPDMAAFQHEVEDSWCRKRKFEKTSRTSDEDLIDIPLINRVLPPEMLSMVFSYLAPKDLMTVMLVCKTWNKAAESRPTLWPWVKLRHLCQLTLERLRGAREMAILKPPTDSWHMLLQTVLQHPGLKKVTLASSYNFEATEADLLTQVFAKMEEVQISERRDWFVKQGNATKCMIDSVLQGSTNLKKLVLRNVDKNQIGRIAEAIATTEAKTLKKLSLDSIDLSLVDASVLGRMATQVEELDITNIHLNQDQRKAIFLAIVVRPGNLKKLSLTSLGTIDANLLALAVNKLECFESIDLSVHQMEKILTKALEATSLKKLNICGHYIISPDLELIAEAKKVIPFISIDRKEESESESESDPISESDSDLWDDTDSDSDSASGSDLFQDADLH